MRILVNRARIGHQIDTSLRKENIGLVVFVLAFGCGLGVDFALCLAVSKVQLQSYPSPIAHNFDGGIRESEIIWHLD